MLKKKERSLHSQTVPERPLLFRNYKQKVVYVRVEFASYHNVQMDFEFSSFGHCAASMAAAASTGI